MKETDKKETGGGEGAVMEQPGEQIERGGRGRERRNGQERRNNIEAEKVRCNKRESD